MSFRDAMRLPDPVELTQTLVRIPSVNPDLEQGGAGEAEIADWLEAWLRERGFAVRRLDHGAARATLVASLRRGNGRRLMLNGHLDTVGAAGMTVEPFAAGIRNGRLYGRGACDMKAGVAAMLNAAASAAAEPWQGELILALVADEENASLGTTAVLESGVRADAAVVCEPTSLEVMPAHKGFAWMQVEVRGRAAHGSRPDIGIDAVRHAGEILAGLSGLEQRIRARAPHPLLGHGSIHAGTIRGGAAPSVYPERCTLVLERRMLPDETAEQAVAELHDLIQDATSRVPHLDASVRLLLAQPGSDVPGQSDVVQRLLRAIQRSGRTPVLGGMTAWVDAALLNVAGIPSVCFGPGSIELAHTADEYVPVAEIAAATDILRDFIVDFLNPSE